MLRGASSADLRGAFQKIQQDFRSRYIGVPWAASTDSTFASNAAG
jgi:hypothetical protein